MKAIHDKNKSERKLEAREINQMWRYGGKSVKPGDNELEAKLKDIAKWIKQELGGL